MKHGDVAWAGIALTVLVYGFFAPPGHVLSQRGDPYQTRHPNLTDAAIVYLAAHLLRVWPRPVDPLHQMAVRANR